ncbi:DinB family protein [Jatrophihabitans sp. YIM 134969]
MRDTLLQYLQQARERVVSRVEGLSEYDAHRPLTPTGTNLLGLVKHLATMEATYLGSCVGRPREPELAWVADGSIWDGADMWATAEQTTADLLDLYRETWAASDAAVRELGLDAPAHMAWWPEDRRDSTLGVVLVRMLEETGQHAGHADIVRELIDGRGPDDADDYGDATYWSTYVATIQAAAETFLRGAPTP